MSIVVNPPTNIFPTKILTSRDNNFSSYRDNMILWMEDYATKNTSTKKSNIGGYQSPDNFYLEESFQFFYDRIVEQIASMTSNYFEGTPISKIEVTNMWFNFNEKNCYNVVHSHPRSSVSGVLWVNTIEEHPPLFFHDPNYNDKYSLGVDHPEYFYYPKDGDMILFPSYLMHGVSANITDTKRISIAFNTTAHYE